MMIKLIAGETKLQTKSKDCQSKTTIMVAKYSLIAHQQNNHLLGTASSQEALRRRRQGTLKRMGHRIQSTVSIDQKRNQKNLK